MCATWPWAPQGPCSGALPMCMRLDSSCPAGLTRAMCRYSYLTSLLCLWMLRLGRLLLSPCRPYNVEHAALTAGSRQPVHCIPAGTNRQTNEFKHDEHVYRHLEADSRFALRPGILQTVHRNLRQHMHIDAASVEALEIIDPTPQVCKTA